MKFFIFILGFMGAVGFSDPACSPETLARLNHFSELRVGEFVSFIDKRNGRQVRGYYHGKWGTNEIFSSLPPGETDQAQQFTLIPPGEIDFLENPKKNFRGQTFQLSSRIVGNYTSSKGEVIEINSQSPALQEQMFLALERMRDGGAKLHTRQTRPTEDELRAVSKAWLRQSSHIEQTRPSDGGRVPYGDKRLLAIDPKSGVGDLGEIVACKAAVCRELSLFGSLALSELGYKTRVARGNIVEEGSLGTQKVTSGHAWIEFLDPQTGAVIGVLDSNYQERFYADRNEYFREARIDPGSVKTRVIAEPRPLH